MSTDSSTHGWTDWSLLGNHIFGTLIKETKSWLKESTCLSIPFIPAVVQHCLSFFVYSWNSVTRSRWDQRKYFELSEVRDKHRLFKTLFSALKSDCQHFGYLVPTSYNVDTIYSRFSDLWRRFKHEIHHKYETLFIYCNNYNLKHNKTFCYHSVSTHRIHVYRKRYK